MPDEIKQFKEELDGLNRTWQNAFADYKAQAKLELEKFGEVTQETKSALDKINEAMTSHEDAIKRIEAKLTRPGSGQSENEKVEARTKAFNRLLRLGPDELSQDDFSALRNWLAPNQLKALSPSSNTEGGEWLAPPEFVAEMIKDLTEISPMRAIARVVATSRGSVQFGKRTGIPTAEWAGEDTEPTDSQSSYGMEEIPAHDLVASVPVQNNLLDDSVYNVEAEIRADGAEAFAYQEGLAFVNGNGVNKPEGFLQNSDVAEVVNGHATQLALGSLGAFTGLIGIQHTVKSTFARRGRWVLNRSTLGQVRLIEDSAGNPIYAPNAALGVPSTILGDPYTEMPDMPSIASGTYPIAYGDWFSAYRIADRRGILVIRDNLTNAKKRRTLFIMTLRVGGQVVLANAIRKLKMST